MGKLRRYEVVRYEVQGRVDGGRWESVTTGYETEADAKGALVYIREAAPLVNFRVRKIVV